VAGSVQPMQDTADTLLALIAAEVQAARQAV
jgi:hypothetical protein